MKGKRNQRKLVALAWSFPILIFSFHPSLFGGFSLSTEINYSENEKTYILGQ